MVNSYQGEDFLLPAIGEGYKAEYWIKIRPDRVYIYKKYDSAGAFPLVNITKEQLELIWKQINQIGTD